MARRTGRSPDGSLIAASRDTARSRSGATPHGASPPSPRPVRYSAPAHSHKLGAATVVGRMAIVALLIAMLTLVYFTARGFSLYQEALSTKDLDEMASSIEGTSSFVATEALPDLYLQAVVAVEDHRFYAHPGIDAIACLRALAHDVQAGAIVEGGSTITQQLAKNQYFTQEQTLERKVAEMFMAVHLEQHFSKQKILELYVNSIYFGEGLYGIGAASQGYFDLDATKLGAYEATLLAGIPNAPSAYALTDNADLARERQKQVIEKLVVYDYLDKADARRILSNSESRPRTHERAFSQP